jgi:hypothetical protein
VNNDFKKSIIVPIFKHIKFKELNAMHQEMMLKVFLKNNNLHKDLRKRDSK